MNIPARLVRFSLAVAALVALPLRAQDAEVPRTRTLPGIENTAFPYAPPEEVGLSSETLARLGDEVAGWVASGDVVGAELLVIKDGQAVFHEAYGWSDLEERQPVERNAVWSIKSMSKPVTATAVLMLAERGALSLDDPVSQYLPAFAGDDRVTVRHLLAQTSGDEGGHGGGGYNVYDFGSLREWVEDWAVQTPAGTVGSFGYSNFNYAALGRIVEVVSGMPVEAFTEREILGPLGLDETYTAFTPDAPWAARVSGRYRWSAEADGYERYWSRTDQQPWSFYPAAFGLWGTAMDYAGFMTMWLDKGRSGQGRLLSEETVETALRPHGFVGEEGVYGYGWFVEASPNADEMPLLFRHGGADGTVAIAFPADNAMVLYLTHSQGVDHLSALQNRVGMLGLFDHPGPYMVWADEHDVREVGLAPGERARYVGSYREGAEDEPGLVVRVTEEGGHLHVCIGEAGRRVAECTHLVPLGEDRFVHGRYEDGRLVALDPYVTLRFTVKDSRSVAVEAVAGDDVEFAARRVESDSLHPSDRTGGQ